MRKIISLSLVLFLCSIGSLFAQAVSPEGAQDVKKFDVYTDKASPSNHYAPSGWMGDVGDLSLDDQNMESPYSGSTAIKITYSAKRVQSKGWAGIYWQNPANNWGNRKGGFDLTGYNKLIFMAKGAQGGEVLSKVKVGGIGATGDVPYPDSAEKESGPIQLTNEWKEYVVNLTDKDLSYISGGFAVIFEADQNQAGAEIFLDDVAFVFDPDLKAEKNEISFPFYIYSDGGSLDNHFIPSGWMPATAAQDIKFNQYEKTAPYSGTSAIRIDYKDVSGTRWAGIYWQNPAENWGAKDGGINLTGATKLTFWARGEKGGERIEEVKVGGIMGQYSDSDSAGIGPVVLTKEWKQYTIDLRGKDLNSIIGGFCWATNTDVNPEGATFYFDEIKYEK